MTTEYRWAGAPLTPRIIGELAAGMFAGQIVRRHTIAGATEKYHLEHGGTPSDAASVLLQTKRALSMLRKEGRVELRDGYGQWRFPPGPGLDDVPVAQPAATETYSPIRIERQIGQGPQVVYAFSYPEYRRSAKRHGRSTWRIKVGWSDNPDAQARVRAQCGEGAPEWPVIHLVIRDTDARELEQLLHRTLKRRGKHLDAPGIEWFDTSPDELLELAAMLLGTSFAA